MRRTSQSLALFIALFAVYGCTCIPRPGYAVMYASGTGLTTNEDRHIYRVEHFASAPQTTDLGASGEKLTDIAIDSCSARAYAITAGKLFSVDVVTGKLQLLGSLPEPGGMNSLEAACGGPLYVWGVSDRRIFSVDPVTLAAQVVVDTRHFGGDLALSPNGKELFGTVLHDNVLLRVDLSSGTTSTKTLKIEASSVPVPGLNFGDGTEIVMPGLDFGPDGKLYGTLGNDSTAAAAVCRIDTKTGLVTVIGPISNGLGNGGMTIHW